MLEKYYFFKESLKFLVWTVFKNTFFSDLILKWILIIFETLEEMQIYWTNSGSDMNKWTQIWINMTFANYWKNNSVN